jgi:hypothetical protein
MRNWKMTALIAIAMTIGVVPVVICSGAYNVAAVDPHLILAIRSAGAAEFVATQRDPRLSQS